MESEVSEDDQPFSWESLAPPPLQIGAELRPGNSWLWHGPTPCPKLGEVSNQTNKKREKSYSASRNLGAFQLEIILFTNCFAVCFAQILFLSKG